MSSPLVETLLKRSMSKNKDLLFSWNIRLKIATEIASAVAYLHSAASIPIFQRDIKSSNILLDEKYTAKVSDFGISRLVENDKTHLTTSVQGTFGYFDPEYFQSHQFTEKSDVFSFGVVLLELFTGEKPISSSRSSEDIYLVTYFASSVREDRFFEILDPQIMQEGKTEELQAVANPAMRCLNTSGRERPTMMEVASELERLRRLDEPSVVPDNGQEVEIFINETLGLWPTSSTTSASTSKFTNLENSIISQQQVHPLMLPSHTF
ncbi:PREDICTED: wall-associated receptor kinase-like 1 [Nelumbo nucifera]|uniref:Wall-associated receptor kinase-like 1 n=1 Tax=Nelumbo nucifera TaxID=4432 RepID=A0A1U8QAW6_NELNU|nr:PREDICTED: wall-associated receptor kinase-like 1 [Nelumbo nucifera]